MNKIYSKSALLATALFSGCLLAAPARLVVSVEVAPLESGYITSQAAVLPETCVTLASGNNWCVPVLTAGTAKVSAQRIGANGTTPNLRSQVVRVPAELAIEEAEYLLKSSGLYSYVERDIVLHTTEAAWNTVTPDDPEFQQQQFFKDNSADNPVASSVLSLWRKVKSPEKNVDVYVLDGGFRLHQDISYADGVSFTVVSYDNERRPGFLEEDFNAECTTSHGLGVASVIGAHINNSEAIAGIAGDITIHPMRVMDCDIGFTSDIAAALDWLSGGSDWLRHSSPDLPEFNGNPGIINMSVGGPSSECSVFLQNAVNKAIAKGFVLVASAGNESTDVALVSPANCEGVISVGAANDADDYTPADLAPFSNYGATLDIMAQGISVPGLAMDEQTRKLAGTSFSSPLVAGLLSVVKKDFDFTPAQWEVLVAISGEHRWTENSRCEQLGCGSGILDGTKLYHNAERMLNGELNTAEYSLNAVSVCRQRWAIANLLPGQALCDQVSVVMDSFYILREREVIKLFSINEGATVNGSTDNMTWLGDFTKNQFKIDKNELLNKDIYGQRCNIDTAVCGVVERVKTDGLDQVPEACL